MSDSKDTVDLLKQAAGGQGMALDELFAREEVRLRRLLALRGGTALLARLDLDDLVQEAYAEAVRQLPTYSYQGRDSFFRWMATIALNRLNNLRRVSNADKRSLKHEKPIVGPETAVHHVGVVEPAGKGPGPRTLASASEGTTQLAQALESLSESDREVILLARIEGLSLDEVAERIGRTRNAVALLLSRALRKLKKKLEPRSDA